MRVQGLVNGACCFFYPAKCFARDAHRQFPNESELFTNDRFCEFVHNLRRTESETIEFDCSSQFNFARYSTFLSHDFTPRHVIIQKTKQKNRRRNYSTFTPFFCRPEQCVCIFLFYALISLTRIHSCLLLRQNFLFSVYCLFFCFFQFHYH